MIKNGTSSTHIVSDIVHVKESRVLFCGGISSGGARGDNEFALGLDMCIGLAAENLHTSLATCM